MRTIGPRWGRGESGVSSVGAGRGAGRAGRKPGVAPGGGGCRLYHRRPGHPVAGSGGVVRLAVGRRVVLVSGTNGKTTTSHLLAAALRTSGPVAHNATGSNMADGAVAALAAARDAEYAVLEVDEWHLAEVTRAVQPAVMVLLNLTRDQLDRGTEVRAVAAAVGAALARLPGALVVANADDPMVVGRSASGPGVVGRGRRRLARRYGDLPAVRQRCTPTDRLVLRLRAGPTGTGLVAGR